MVRSCSDKENEAPLSGETNLKPAKNAVWSLDNDATLVGVLAEQQAEGHQAGNGWKTVVWPIALKELEGSEGQGGPKIISSCINHWKTVSYTLTLGQVDVLI
jgi:hypothetical protein